MGELFAAERTPQALPRRMAGVGMDFELHVVCKFLTTKTKKKAEEKATTVRITRYSNV